MPLKQMGIAVESQKTMYVHQVWMLVAGFPVSDVLTIKCLEFFCICSYRDASVTAEWCLKFSPGLFINCRKFFANA